MVKAITSARSIEATAACLAKHTKEDNPVTGGIDLGALFVGQTFLFPGLESTDHGIYASL